MQFLSNVGNREPVKRPMAMLVPIEIEGILERIVVQVSMIGVVDTDVVQQAVVQVFHFGQRLPNSC